MALSAAKTKRRVTRMKSAWAACGFIETAGIIWYNKTIMKRVIRFQSILIDSRGFVNRTNRAMKKGCAYEASRH